MDLVEILVVALAVVLVVSGIVLLRRRPPIDGEARPPSAPPITALGPRLRRAWGSGPDDTTWDRLEEVLLSADVGVGTTQRVIAGVQSARPETFEEARDAMAELLVAEMAEPDRRLQLDGSPATVFVVGVNGTGKTTTIAKLGKRLMDEGKTVLLAAADTFRAAAGEQLQVWGDRIGAPVVAGERGADPASVAFDALSSARARGIDVVLIDSAGRLHDRKDLMSELAKIHRVAAGETGVAETLLVIDATSGQNVISQVAVFTEAVPVTGLVLTKLDGTARGGMVIAVEHELGAPVKLVGIGERVEDLEPFEPRSFVESLLET